MALYEGLLRPVLFAMDPETAHERAVRALGFAGRSSVGRRLLEKLFVYRDAALEISVAGIRFPNPIGLAAGFDKDCKLAHALPSLGFGFVELGTITPLGQPGNPKPRIFRAPAAQALVNRLGFNNEGAQAAADRLGALKEHRVPIGINLGKNRDTPAEDAIGDYLSTFKVLSPFADYLVVNVSSPNTRGLRDLQDRLRLERLLVELQQLNAEKKPIFVKLSPDLSTEQLDSLCPLLLQCAQGAVISNTTLSREGLPADMAALEGGLSGAPLKSRSTALIAEVYRKTDGKLPIIGVGGVFDAADAFEKLRAGASLVQIYTGFIYRGPGVVREILQGLATLLRERGLASVSDAVGLDHRAAAHTT